MRLSSPEIYKGHVYPGRTPRYFEEQWENQRTSQLEAMDESQKRKRERLVVLLELEERLLVSR